MCSHRRSTAFTQRGSIALGFLLFKRLLCSLGKLGVSLWGSCATAKNGTVTLLLRRHLHRPPHQPLPHGPPSCEVGCVATKEPLTARKGQENQAAADALRGEWGS